MGADCLARDNSLSLNYGAGSGSQKRCLKGSQCCSGAPLFSGRGRLLSVKGHIHLADKKERLVSQFNSPSQPRLSLSLHRMLKRQRYFNLLAWAQFLIPPYITRALFPFQPGNQAGQWDDSFPQIKKRIKLHILKWPYGTLAKVSC